MRYNNIEIEVLIKGRPITEYPHNGQVFVEGRDKSEFTLRVTNHNHFRVEAVVSVDGLSVLDGKDAGPASAGYVVDARQSVTIPGWKLSDAQVANFLFGGKGNSYAATGQSGSVRNTGVIGVMAFKERHQNRYDRPVYAQPFNGNLRTFAPTSDASGGYSNTIGTSINGIVPDPYLTGGSFETYGVSNCMAASGPLDWLEQDQYRGGAPKAMGMVGGTLSAASSMSSNSPSRGLGVQAMGMADGVSTRSRGLTKSAVRHEPVVQQNLGTGFGRASDFATETVDFQRGDMVAMVVVRYDDARGLRQRGIVIDRRARQQQHQEANPFPGMSCAPPPGWRG